MESTPAPRHDFATLADILAAPSVAPATAWIGIRRAFAYDSLRAMALRDFLYDEAKILVALSAGPSR